MEQRNPKYRILSCSLTNWGLWQIFNISSQLEKISRKQHSLRFWRPWLTEPYSADKMKLWRASHTLKVKRFQLLWQLNMLDKPTVSKRRRYWQVKLRIKQTNNQINRGKERTSEWALRQGTWKAETDTLSLLLLPIRDCITMSRCRDLVSLSAVTTDHSIWYTRPLSEY